MSSVGNDLPTCLLTGASGQLGLALLQTMRSEMNFVAVFRSKVPEVESNLATCVYPPGILSSEGEVFFVQADLTDEREIERTVEVAGARFGTIDHVINAAADSSFYGSTSDINRYAKIGLDQVWLNCFVPGLVASAVARRLWKNAGRAPAANGRSILNVSSVSGINIYQGSGQATYSLSKAALHFLTCHMANDYTAFGARVNALAPTAFPHVIPTAVVVDAIRSVLFGTWTGKILKLDENGLASIN